MKAFVAPSVYWIDDLNDLNIRKTKENYRVPFGLVVECENLHIIGLPENPEDAVLASNRGQTQGASGNFTMFFFRENALTLEKYHFR